MFTKAFVKTAAAMAVVKMASAQTFTDCNPMEKECPAQAAIGKESADCDFTKGECSIFDTIPGTSITYEGDGARFRIAGEGDGPTIATHKRIFFGRVDVELKSAPGIGIVTSVVLESSDLDEVDWEWLGADQTQVQSNYFGKGDTSTYDRVVLHPIADHSKAFHTYTIEATSKFITWSIDGNEVRRLTPDQAKGGSRFPQTPFEVKLGTWVAGGKDTPEGTVEWAGGYTDFGEAPFDAYYKSVSIVDYAGGDAPTTDSIKEYIYGDKSGSWESIEVVKGDSLPDDHDEGDDKKTTTTKDSSKTKTEDSSKTTDSSESTKTSDSDDDDDSTATESGSSETTITSTVTSSGSTTVKTITTSGPANEPTAEPTASTTATDDGSSDSPSETGGSDESSPSESAPSTSPPSAATHGVVSFATLACAGAFALFTQML